MTAFQPCGVSGARARTAVSTSATKPTWTTAAGPASAGRYGCSNDATAIRECVSERQSGSGCSAPDIQSARQRATLSGVRVINRRERRRHEQHVAMDHYVASALVVSGLLLTAMHLLSARWPIQRPIRPSLSVAQQQTPIATETARLA